jgi:hypothetical protein
MAKWIYKTRAGLAEIRPESDGVLLIFDDEHLEHRASPAAAAEALASGTCF